MFEFLTRLTVGGDLSPALRARSLFALIVTISLAGTVNADQAREFELNIPRQPVETALNELATQVGAMLLFPYDPVQSVDSNAVVGRHTVAEALEILLEDSSLSGGFTEGGVITISQMKSVEAEEEPEGDNMNVKKKAGLLAVLASVFTGNTNAQEAPDPGDEKDQPVPLEEIIVTGTHIRGIRNDFSPVLSFDRAEIDRMGFGSVPEFIESLPQNFGGGSVSIDTAALSVGDGAGNTFGGSGINLRGLGASSTLVLLNGRRLPAGGLDGQFVDISTIPLSALERIEVLTDGASAIYGSDAIGGVVNFVMRDDYDGAETRLRYGSVTDGGLEEIRLSQALGTSWDSGNVFLSLEYFTRSSLLTDERPFTSSNLAPLGGVDNRVPGGNPANIFVGGQFWAIPTGQDGRSLTAADFDAATPLNVYDPAAGIELFPEEERFSAFASLRQEISARAGLFADGRFSTRTSDRARPVGLNLTVPDTNAFFVDPSGSGSPAVLVANYQFKDELGRIGVAEATVESIGGTVGGWVNFAQSWQAELAISYAKEEGTSKSFNRLDLGALNVALASSDPNTAFNPFGDGSNTNRALIESLIVPGPIPGLSDAESDLWSVNFKVDGTVAELRGGAVKLAGGAEFRNETLANSTTRGPLTGPFVTTPGLTGERDVIAAYSEVFIPLVGEGNARPGLARLELSVAARYEDYSDFGDSVDPKVGLLWSPVAGLTFRGTYGTSYKAPLLRDLDTSNESANFVFWVPFADDTLFFGGGNPGLSPQTANTWTAGIDYSSENLSGFSISLTYFDIDYDDLIRVPSELLAGFASPEFAALVNENPTVEEITELVNRPGFRNFFGGSAADLISGAVNVNRIGDARINNIARSSVTGFESQMSYKFDSNAGEFSFGLNLNYLFDFESVFIATLPLVEHVDTLANPVDLRLRGSASWSRGGWYAGTYLNYTDSYSNDTADPIEKIESWTTVDAQLTYSFEGRSSSRFLDGVRLTLSAQNLFDEDPPFVQVQSDFGFAFGYDPANAEALGRFVAFELTKDW